MRERGARRAAVMVAVTVTCVLSGALMAAVASGATIRLTGRVVSVTNNYMVDGSPHCSVKNILLIKVPSDVVSYTASVKQTGPYFTSTLTQAFSFSGPPFTNPITGFGNPYHVPTGEAGWFISGGSGPAPCTIVDTYSDLKATGTIETATVTATISAAQRLAMFTLNSTSAAAHFQCALIKKTKQHHKPVFRSCRSPKVYKHLSPGRYTFEARLHSSGATSPATSKSFTIS